MDLGLQKGSGSAPPTHCTRQMLHHSVTGSAKPDKNNAAGAAWSEDDELWKRRLKLARTENSGHNPVFSTEGHQMLSFSGPEKLTSSFPYFYNTSASIYNRSFTGNHGCGAAAAAEICNDVRGPFTHSQWMELEHQALIYQHITSNIPVPSTLLMPIRRALSHAAFSHYSAGHVTPMGWDGFQLGLPSSNDPEPGRCRRTDGKKWRCSRDAVADHKYCERHINRGRHRSRKPVEGHLAPVPISPAAVGGTGCGTFGPSESPDSSRVFMSKHFTSSYGQSPAWEFRSAPMGLGGPLGEALQNSSGTTTTTTTNTSSGLHLMTRGWDKNPKLTSSPTGVLQKEAAFASRTTSSSGTNAATATY